MPPCQREAWRIMSFYRVARGAAKLYYKLFFRVKIVGEENLSDGTYVICPNHKSLNDPPLMGVCIKTPVKFMAKEELFKNKFFDTAMRALGAFPVKRGKSDLAALKTAISTLKGGDNLVVFPEGTRSPKDHLNEGKSGAALIAAKAGVDIVPVGIRGRYRIFSKVTVNIGKPISMDEYFGKRLDSKTLAHITDSLIMPEISKLSGIPTFDEYNKHRIEQ